MPTPDLLTSLPIVEPWDDGEPVLDESGFTAGAGVLGQPRTEGEVDAFLGALRLAAPPGQQHVTTRAVPSPRMIDALTPRQRTAALERLARDHRPVVALAVAEAIEGVRRG